MYRLPSSHRLVNKRVAAFLHPCRFQSRLRSLIPPPPLTCIYISIPTLHPSDGNDTGVQSAGALPSVPKARGRPKGYKNRQKSEKHTWAETEVKMEAERRCRRSVSAVGGCPEDAATETQRAPSRYAISELVRYRYCSHRSEC